MIAKLFIFLLKSSFLFVNATLLSAISMCCSDGKKKNQPISPPPTTTEDTIKKAHNSTTSTEKEQTRPFPPMTQSCQPPSCSSSTPSVPKSKAKTPEEKPQKSQLKLDKTQRIASKESLRPPPRTIRKGPIIKSREAQKTLKDVKEFSAREGPILGEKSTNQQDFDDYLNNLGENKN